MTESGPDGYPSSEEGSRREALLRRVPSGWRTTLALCDGMTQANPAPSAPRVSRTGREFINACSVMPRSSWPSTCTGS